MPDSHPHSSSPKGSSRASARAEGNRSRDRILDAAEQLLSDRGFAGTGIAAISQASGLPASSIYWHFENKEDLVASTVERATERWIAELEAAKPGPEASAAEMIAFVSRSTEEMGRKLPFFIRISMLLGLELGHREPALLARLQRGRDRSRELVRSTIEHLLTAEGTPLSPQVAEEVARLTLAFTEGLFMARVFEPDALNPEKLSNYIEVAMRAIAAQRQSEVSS